MSFLLESILACAPDTPLDARDHWPLHEALRSLDEWLSQEAHHQTVWRTAGFPALHFVKDPDVGWRASGVTRAIWDLVTSGILECIEEHDGRAQFVLKASATPHLRRDLMHLSPECTAALQRAGHRFAQNVAIAS